ncbi:hypothetical protein RI129_010962 [Pyrocoelia pectoralis]|uniref:Uncharacterized protein n=1 Tax=Pyrocoelia pectoralis TaxID=417401 RepID=A0AAN7V775_9COLE
MEAEYEQIKIKHIRDEWLQHQQTLAELQECYFQKSRLLSVHGTYCSAQGTTFCSLITILLYEEDTLQSFLDNNDHLIGLITIAVDFLNSFSITYSVQPPLEDSPDYKFIVSLYTCLVIFAGDVAGRIFLISKKQAQDSIWDIIHYIVRIHHESMRKLKILIWTFLRNLTSDPDGILFLQGCSTLLVRISDCLRDDYDEKMCKCALEILDRLSSTISNIQYLKDIENNIDMHQLKILSDPCYIEVHLLPKKIFRNIGRAAKDFINDNAQGDIENVKSNTIRCRCKHSAQIPIGIGSLKHLHPCKSKSRSGGDTSSSTSTRLKMEKGTQVRCLPRSHKHKTCSKKSNKQKKPKCNNSTCCQTEKMEPSNDKAFTRKASLLNEERQIRSVNLNESKESLVNYNVHCTCPVKSEKQLVPWTPERSMISYLAEVDRRIPTARIINHVSNTQSNKRQRIISRIKISGLTFK